MVIISKYILYFFIYAFLGWIMEVCVFLVSDKKFVNRGFLIGPICPIYGYGVLLIVTLIGNTSDLLTIFLKSIFVCSILEYFTSYFMEKIFNARWWDYSNKRFNINGRICLETMIPFGILGSLVTKYLHPAIVRIVSTFSSKLIIILAIIVFVIYLVDNAISFNVLNKIKNQIKSSKSDNTEVIRKKVLAWIDSNSRLFKRIKEAFPGFEIYKKVMKRIKK